MRWRAGACLLMVLTAAVAVGASVLGPLYLRAATDSLIRVSVGGASSVQTGLTVSAQTGAQVTFSQVQRETQKLAAQYDLTRWFGRPIVTVVSGVNVPLPGDPPMEGQLLSRSGICGQLRFRAGSCAVGAGDVLVSTRTARATRVALGSTLRAIVRSNGASLHLRVTGIYSAPNPALPYWWGQGVDYFPQGASGSAPQADALITSAATALAVPASDVPAITAQLPLRRGVVGLADRGTVAQTLGNYTRAASDRGLIASTGITGLFAGVEHQVHLMDTVIAVASVQLVLVAVWVLASLLLRSAELRSSEVTIARLRGFPLSSLFAVAVGEPAILCLIGAVAGVLGGWLLTVVAKSLFMSTSASITLGPLVFAALAAAVITVALVLVATALRALRNSELRDRAVIGQEPSGRMHLVADASLLLLAVVALVALATSGALAAHGNPIASVAPGLLALGTTVLAVRLMLLLCRWGVDLTAMSTWVPGMLALRQVARRPAILREGRVLIVTLCLACFGVSAWSIAKSNRETAATFAVGAATVVTVNPHGTDLLAAVDKVDPHGRFAMAVVQGSTSGTALLGVDPSRLAAVGFWPSGITSATLGQIARKLAPATPPTVRLPAGVVRFDAHVSGTGELATHLAGFDLNAWVFNPQVGTTIVKLGTLRPGDETYTGSTRFYCDGGCRLVGIGVVPQTPSPIDTPGSIDLTLKGVAAGATENSLHAVPADLSAGGWRTVSEGVTALRTPSDELGFQIPTAALAVYEGGLTNTSLPMFNVADYPLNIPGIVGPGSLNGAVTSYGKRSISTIGLDGNSISIAPVLTASSLPRVGSDGQLVDLSFLTRAQADPLGAGATQEVWLNSAAPADAISRLAAAGLTVDGVQRAGDVATSIEQAGPELAYDFMLLATLVALLAGATSSLGLLGSELRDRATELTALEVAGVRRPMLVRALWLESLILVVTAMFGALAGIVGSALAIPSLPEPAATLGAPRSYALPWPLLLAVCAGMIILIAGASVVSTAGLLRRMSPSLLWSGSDDS
jgi:hypothetical protein